MPPPRKMQHRGEDDVQINITIILKSFAAPIQERKLDDGDSKKQLTSTSSKEVEDEKQKENISSVTSTVSPVSKSGHKRLQDYSTFQGPGRYAKDLQSSDQTVNTEYAIDPV